MKKQITLLFLSIFLIGSVFAFTYTWEQFDGSVSHYTMIKTEDPNIHRARLIAVEDVVLNITREPYIQEQMENKYIPACFEK